MHYENMRYQTDSTQLQQNTGNMHTGISEPVKKKIYTAALTSRIIIILIQYAASLLPQHDAHVFLYPKQAQEKLLDPVVQAMLGGFVRWDAQHFMHIALNGYTYENSAAFLPLLPIIIRSIMYILYPATSVMSEDSLALLIYIVFNVVVFLKAAEVLYKLTAEVFDEKFALKTVLIFCVNPASIFFTAPYTECLFSYLTLSAIYHSWRIKIRGESSDLIKAVTFIALSTCVRSNGTLNIGFLLHFFAQRMFKDTFKSLITLLPSLIACLVPFITIQYYFYGQFCKNFKHNLPDYIVNQADLEGFVLPGEFSTHNQSWCYYKTIPLPYQYVQDKYWNVGLFRYYETKQIPNFFLAFPVMYIVLTGGFHYLYKNCAYLLHLGIFKNVGKESAVFVCVVHAVFLAMFCLLCVHVQVATRMIFSATPAVYWFCASSNEKWIKYYCWGYIIVGTMMFATFLPWT